jgi:hypothetical protein
MGTAVTAFSLPALQYTPSLVIQAMRLPTEFTALIMVRSFFWVAVTTFAASFILPLCNATRKVLSFVFFASLGKLFLLVLTALRLWTMLKDPKCFMSFLAYLAALRPVLHADSVRYLTRANLIVLHPL